jgi:signal recognition particle receptor subunit beta
MAFARSSRDRATIVAQPGAKPAKIVVSGGFAAGKTTFVGAISEIEPLTTEAVMTSATRDVDDIGYAGLKTTTTVGIDFGRITVASDLVLYLFGTPGQGRFFFAWDELTRGAVGAIIMVDTRRIADSFPAIDYFEEHDVPFVVAINCFNGWIVHDMDLVRRALVLDPAIPIGYCDARERTSARDILVTLVEHVIRRTEAAARSQTATSAWQAGDADAQWQRRDWG